MNIIKTELITNYIKSHKLTIKEFCMRCKISTNIYYKIINNKINIKINNLFKIANLLKIDVYQLLNE